MTPRENMLRIFRHERPGWIPLTCHVDPYNQPNKTGMSPDLAAQLAEVKWCDGTTVHLSRALGIDVMDYTSAPLRRTYRQVTIENRRDGESAITTWHTPAGDLTQRQCIPADAPPYISEHLVKKPARATTSSSPWRHIPIKRSRTCNSWWNAAARSNCSIKRYPHE